MESRQSSQTNNDQIAELSERMARMEIKMDFVATQKSLAAARARDSDPEALIY